MAIWREGSTRSCWLGICERLRIIPCLWISERRLVKNCKVFVNLRVKSEYQGDSSSQRNEGRNIKASQENGYMRDQFLRYIIKIPYTAGAIPEQNLQTHIDTCENIQNRFPHVDKNHFIEII